MIKLEHKAVFNFEGAIRGMRNPMNSWDKSDSYWDAPEYPDRYVIGPEDMKLARKLINAGSDHRKFIRQIFVSVDITAPLYWWKEFDTYKVGTVANSTSTMHKIHAKRFSREDFSIEHVDNMPDEQRHWMVIMDNVISSLNVARDYFNESKNKDYWHIMIEMLPESYNQTRTVTMNYENAINMYKARKNHKLDEWHVFCDWVTHLPYFKEFFLEEVEDGRNR